MSDTQHIPEMGLDAQLQTAVDAALEADTSSTVDASFAGTDAVLEQTDMSPLQQAFSALQLMSVHDPSRHVLDHWTEDAKPHPHSLIEELYFDVMRELVQQAVADDAEDVNPLGYEETQPPTLDLHPDPEETFSHLREQVPSDPSSDDIYDVMDEFSDTYRAWKDTVVVQHILYLTDEVGVELHGSGFEDQLGNGEPVGAPLVDYVWGSALWFLTETYLKGEDSG